jgi:glyoxylase-like metal-dependent hydrolase (beta-lactamase superfamily II)
LCWIAACGNSGYIDKLWKPQPAPSRFLAEGDQVGALRVLHIPGHTPGSIALFDAESGVIFTGDCLFKNGVGRTDLPGGNMARLQESLNRLLALDPALTVCSGHNEITTIGAERYPRYFPKV